MANPSDPIVTSSDDVTSFKTKMGLNLIKKGDPPGKEVTGVANAQFIGAGWGNAVDDALIAVWERVDAIGGSGDPALATRVTDLETDVTGLTTDVSTLESLVTGFPAQYAAIDSPTFTGSPSAPTPTVSDDSTRIATTAWVKSQGYTSATGFAPIASPAFTGVPTAPTASLGTDTDQIATTAFVLANAGGDTSGLAPLASPAFTGSPTAPTPGTGTNSTRIATTSYVKNQGYATLDSPTFTGDVNVPTIPLEVASTLAASTAWVRGQGYAPVLSPSLVGTPTAPTPSPGTDNFQIATTAFVQNALAGAGGGYDYLTALQGAMNSWQAVQVWGETPKQIIGWIRGDYQCGVADYVYESNGFISPHKYSSVQVTDMLFARTIAIDDFEARPGVITLRGTGDEMVFQVYSQGLFSTSVTKTKSYNGPTEVKCSKHNSMVGVDETVYFAVKDDSSLADDAFRISRCTATMSGSPVLTVDTYYKVLAGSGELYIDGIDDVCLVGRGPNLYRSTNGGATFTLITDFNGDTFESDEITDVSMNKMNNPHTGTGYGYRACAVGITDTNQAYLYYTEQINGTFSWRQVYLGFDVNGTGRPRCAMLNWHVLAVFWNGGITYFQLQTDQTITKLNQNPFPLPFKPNTIFSVFAPVNTDKQGGTRLSVVGGDAAYISGVLPRPEA